MKKLLIWSTDIPSVITGKGNVGGINVQLYFWAKIFVKNGWQVSSFTEGDECEMEGIHFYHRTYRKHIDAIIEWFLIAHYLIKVKPDLVMNRGSHRSVYPLAVLCGLFHIKYVFFGASDVNFEPSDPRSFVGNSINRKMYHRGVGHCKYIVAQNQYQYDKVAENYGKDSLQLLNIWMKDEQTDAANEKDIDVIWVANFRPLKRPEWVLEAARQMTDKKFVIIGGPGSKKYYNEIKALAQEIGNLDFKGPQPFAETNDFVSKSKILACTSEIEGFPNTFLQAWVNNIPVVSTVNPSGVIDKYNLGIVVGSEDEFQQAIQNLLSDNEDYAEKQRCIAEYFERTHGAQSNYDKLLVFIGIDDL